MPQQRLTDFEDLYRVLVETSTDLILVTDGAGRISYANGTAQEILGYELEEMVGAEVSSFVAPEFEAEVASVAERAIRGRPQAQRNLLARRRDGELIQLRLSATPVAGSDEEGGAALIATDVSEQEQRERELAQLIRDNELILRSVGDGIIRLDPRGLITLCQPGRGQHPRLQPRRADGAQRARAASPLARQRLPLSERGLADPRLPEW